MECTTVSVITTITTAATITTTTTTMSVTDVYSDASNTQTSIDPFCPLGIILGFLLIRGVERGVLRDCGGRGLGWGRGSRVGVGGRSRGWRSRVGVDKVAVVLSIVVVVVVVVACQASRDPPCMTR